MSPRRNATQVALEHMQRQLDRLINPPVLVPAHRPVDDVDLSQGAVNAMPLAFMSIAEVARALRISRQWALRLVRRGSIPGGEMMYRFEQRRGERWHVDRELFTRWRESMVAAGIGDAPLRAPAKGKR